MEEIFNNNSRVVMTDWGEMDHLRIISEHNKGAQDCLGTLADGLWRGGWWIEMKMVKNIMEDFSMGWLEGIGQSACGQFVTGKLRVNMKPDMKVMRNFKDRLEGKVVGDIVTADSLFGGRKVMEMMKQTIRSNMEMLKRSSSLTNGDHFHTEEKPPTPLQPSQDF